MSRNKNKSGKVAKNIVATPLQNWVALGKTAFKRGDYRQAITQWEKAWAAPNLAPDQNVRLTAALAEAHFREGQFRLFSAPVEALALLTRAAELADHDALYAHHVGVALHRLGELDSALKWYQKALDRDPAFKRSAYEICVILRLKQQPVAVATNRAWSLLDPRQQARFLGKPTEEPIESGLAAYAAGDWEQAQRLLTAVSAQTALPTKVTQLANYYLGALAQRSADSNAALTYWSAAMDDGMQTAALSHNVGLAYTLQSERALAAGDLSGALSVAETGLRLQQDHKRLLELQGYLRFHKGYQLAEQGKWKQALDIWKPVDTLAGINGRYLAANRAIAYEKLELYAEAAGAWREFVRRRPRTEGADNVLSEEQVARLWERVAALYMRGGQVEEAISSIQTALKYQPDDIRMGLGLTRLYLEAERNEAALNQMARLFKQYPKHIDVLVLRAEMAEAGITMRRWVFGPTLDGIDEWEAVYATGDETYAPIARERLEALYPDFAAELAYLDDYARRDALFVRGLNTLPDFHILRALYVSDLLKIKKRRKEALEQMALIDLMNDLALHHLIDGWHTVNEPEQAKALLEKAEALRTRNADFYLGIAGCAADRGQPAISDMYYQEALLRAKTLKERQKIQVSLAMNFVETDPNKAIKLLTDITDADKNCVQAWINLTVGYRSMGNLAAMNRSLRAAERAARATKDPADFEAVEQLKAFLNSPIAGMPGIAGMVGKMGGLPPLPPDIADGDADEDDAPDDAFELDLDQMGGQFLDMQDIQDMLDNPVNNPPVSDRRRRRMEKQTPPDKQP